MTETLDCVLVHDAMPIMASGLPALAGRLVSRGHSCEVWNLRAERMRGRDPTGDLATVDLVGVSVHWFYQLPPALALARRCREEGWKGHIVFGGFTASVFAEEILSEHGDVDSVVRGDGEVPLERLAAEISRPRPDLDRVPNLAWRDGAGVRANDVTYVGRDGDLDSLEMASLDRIRHLADHLDSSSWRSITDGSPSLPAPFSRTFYLGPGRGCRFSCACCGGGRAAHRIHSGREGVALRSVDRLADDVEKATGLGCTSIHACFDPRPNGGYWHDFMDELARRKVRTSMIFESFGLPDERFLGRFADVFEHGVVVISPETADEDVRREVRGAFFSNDELEQRLGLVGELGLRAQVFLGYFTPLEGLSGLHASRRWARRLAREHGRYVDVMHYPYSTDPASPLWSDPARWRMKVNVRRASDYIRQMERREPWLGNLLGHEPDRRGDWEAATLGVELEQALMREDPVLHGSLERGLSTRLDAFFLELARGLLASRPRSDLERSKLAGIVRSEVPGR